MARAQLIAGSGVGFGFGGGGSCGGGRVLLRTSVDGNNVHVFLGWTVDRPHGERIEMTQE